MRALLWFPHETNPTERMAMSLWWFVLKQRIEYLRTYRKISNSFYIFLNIQKYIYQVASS